MDELQDLIARIMKLTPEERRQIAVMVGTTGVAEAAVPYGVSDSPADATPRRDSSDMKLLTLVLPDDLVKEVQAAGLLASGRIEELIRRALHDADTKSPDSLEPQVRRLVREDDRLVVEALHGERPISDSEVRAAWNDMES